MEFLEQNVIESPARLFSRLGFPVVNLDLVRGVFVGIMDYVGIVGNRWNLLFPLSWLRSCFLSGVGNGWEVSKKPHYGRAARSTL